MRISDWSSDVCSSDLAARRLLPLRRGAVLGRRLRAGALFALPLLDLPQDSGRRRVCDQSGGEGRHTDRKSVGEGKSVSVRVDLGGRRKLKKKNNNKNCDTYVNIRSDKTQ